MLFAARQGKLIDIIFKLNFSNSIEKSISDADAIFIAVGTPERRGDGHADLTYLYAAAK
ncbi:MAG: hypothetical protein QF526_06900, partial [Alphaproteobacteria bacterium]|nr:hypothetical protein [Alphaproteobacteria bacterium]